MYVSTCITGHQCVAEAGTPKYGCYRRFHLKSADFPAATIRLENDNEAIIGCTRKKRPVMRERQSIDGIVMFFNSLLQQVLTHVVGQGRQWE